MTLKLGEKARWQLEEFDKPIITATYFGFIPIVAPKITSRDLELTSHCVELPHYDAAEKAALIRTYLDENFSALPHPLSLIYRKNAVKKKLAGYHLHFIGASSGIAEATLIRAALSILTEIGHKNMRVDINCIGDKESLSYYERELINFIKKFGGHLSEELKLALKEDVFNLFRSELEEAASLRVSAPSAITYLSAQSRNHFKEVLEFIEALDIEFSLAPELVGEKHHASHTVFAIRNTEPNREADTSAPLATGYRYSQLVKRFGIKREIPMAGVSIFLGQIPVETRAYKELPKPKFYLVQLGREAKIRTLGLIEELRRERIPVHHFLGKDKLAAQLLGAEQLRVSYLIIIGQKEALDSTATVRNIATRAQDTIPLSQLPSYLKHISL